MQKSIEPISKELSKTVRLRFHHQIINEIRQSCLNKAVKEMEEGKWDDLKQLRLDGVLYICKKIKPSELTISIVAWLAYQNGFEIDFKLLPKDRSDIVFTDTGVENESF